MTTAYHIIRIDSLFAFRQRPKLVCNCGIPVLLEKSANPMPKIASLSLDYLTPMWPLTILSNEFCCNVKLPSPSFAATIVDYLCLEEKVLEC